MHKLLHDWLLKLNVKPGELSGEEKETFDRWNAVLGGEELSVEQIATFCEGQKQEIEKRFEDLDNSPQKNERLILLFTVYNNIIQALHAGEQERKSLEEHLTKLLDEPTI